MRFSNGTISAKDFLADNKASTKRRELLGGVRVTRHEGMVVAIVAREVAAGRVKTSEERIKDQTMIVEAGKNRGVAGKRVDLDNRFFRSKAEANYARFLNYCIAKKIGGMISWEYEVKEFEFPVKRGQRFYKPDFKVNFSDGRYQWHEVKGWMDDKSKTKIARFKQYYPEEHARLELIMMADIQKIKNSFQAALPDWE